MEQPKTKDRDFVHLHLHSDYSLLQSTIQLKPLAASLRKHGMQACAVTDHGNMYGAISFYREMRSAGIRPIIGYEALLTAGSRSDRTSSLAPGERPYYNLVLLARNLEGYQNLVKLSSMAFTEGFYHKPRIDLDLLSENAGGLICLSGGTNGAISHYLTIGHEHKAVELARRLSDIFAKGEFFIEIESHGVDGESELNRSLIDLSRRNGLPIVASNNVYYLERGDAGAQEVLMCLADGRTVLDPGRRTFPNDTFYLRSAEEMWELFGNELPEALENTLRIAEACDLVIPTDKLILPNFPVPDDVPSSSVDEYFELVVRNGLEKLMQTDLQPMIDSGELKYPPESYRRRLEEEIRMIEGMGFASYFLVVWDFIRFAKQHGIPVGPGRGSAAGSLVAYSLGITAIDPLQNELFFERFLNPERISMPDIDIDFCIRGRAKVIEHVTERYGRESVCQIITFGTMQSKAAIKDVGRALNMPLPEVERIAKLIPPPFRGRITSISSSIERVPELKALMAADPKVAKLIDLALRVEGCSRHTSVHAAGVVISPRPLHEIVPVALSPKNELTSQYPMGDLEKVGMLKMDFLGLTTLTIIDDCLRFLREKAGIEIDWRMISLRDEQTMHLFSEGRTDAVFQFESSGMQEICRRLKPKELEDLSALNALYRPGPIDGGMIEDFILRHRGEKKVEYIVPEMEDVLKNTYGVLVYQEQIMQLAQKLAGYTLGEADMMRRAMGKKKREEMVPHEKKFIAGAVERGIARKKAAEIFNLMSQFADYGFNRSHSIAYAYLAFQTAYLKAHYPSYFYAAVLSHEADDAAKVYKYSNELRSMGLRLLPPDVNESDEGFTPTHDSVRFGLSAIKGMGASSARSIIEARTAAPFTSLFDFAERVEQNAVNRRTLESLVAAGAFDSLRPADSTVNLWRAVLFASIDVALAQSQAAWNDKLLGQSGLFVGEPPATVDEQLVQASPWTTEQLAAKEKAAIGFYLSAHPLEDFADFLANQGVTKLADRIELQTREEIRVAGIISGLQVRWSRKGNRFAQFRIEDQTAGLKCLMWGDVYQRAAGSLADDALLIVDGRIESAEGQALTLIVSDVRSLVDAVVKKASSVEIDLPEGKRDEDSLQELYSVLNMEPGHCDLDLRLQIDGLDVKLRSGPLRIQASSRLEEAIIAQGFGVEWEH